jgi:hypothetical protein
MKDRSLAKQKEAGTAKSSACHLSAAALASAWRFAAVQHPLTTQRAWGSQLLHIADIMWAVMNATQISSARTSNQPVKAGQRPP